MVCRTTFFSFVLVMRRIPRKKTNTLIAPRQTNIGTRTIILYHSTNPQHQNRLPTAFLSFRTSQGRKSPKSFTPWHSSTPLGTVNVARHVTQRLSHALLLTNRRYPSRLGDVTKGGPHYCRPSARKFENVIALRRSGVSIFADRSL